MVEKMWIPLLERNLFVGCFILGWRDMADTGQREREGEWAVMARLRVKEAGSHSGQPL